jgi:hypothetical protein
LHWRGILSRSRATEVYASSACATAGTASRRATWADATWADATWADATWGGAVGAAGSLIASSTTDDAYLVVSGRHSL